MSDEIMRLFVLRPGVSEREYENPEQHGDHATTESADAVLAALKGEWCQAELCASDTRHDGWRCVRRRLPSTGWREARRWPDRAQHETRRECYVDVDAIAAWLRDMGVTIEWPAVLARQWPGHERGRLHAACALDTDRSFRSGHARHRDALEYVVREIVSEGQESGALVWRVDHNCDEHDKAIDRARERLERERAEMRALRNEVRRLKGEPEISEEEERAAARAETQESVRQFLASRKTATT